MASDCFVKIKPGKYFAEVTYQIEKIKGDEEFLPIVFHIDSDLDYQVEGQGASRTKYKAGKANFCPKANYQFNLFIEHEGVTQTVSLSQNLFGPGPVYALIEHFNLYLYIVNSHDDKWIDYFGPVIFDKSTGVVLQIPEERAEKIIVVKGTESHRYLWPDALYLYDDKVQTVFGYYAFNDKGTLVYASSKKELEKERKL